MVEVAERVFVVLLLGRHLAEVVEDVGQVRQIFRLLEQVPGADKRLNSATELSLMTVGSTESPQRTGPEDGMLLRNLRPGRPMPE